MICPALDATTLSEEHEEDTRLSLVAVEWPSDDQPVRPWTAIEAEFRRVIAPLWELPFNQGRDRMLALDGRYKAWFDEWA